MTLPENTDTQTSCRRKTKRGETICYEDTVLGAGDFGQVFEGLFDGKKVAVKRIRQDEYNKTEEELLKLSHPNLVKYLAIYNEEGAPFVFITMEFCLGNLEHIIQNTYKGPPIGSVEELLLQTTLGLEYLHSEKIIHRDIKPHNILISAVVEEGYGEKSVAKIADFGLCKKNGTDASSFSQSASIIGPPEWSAPECIDGGKKRIKVSADVFSLGCVFGYALTGGSHPFGDERLARADRIIRGEINWQKKHSIENEEMRTMITSMLSNEPEKRPQQLSSVIKLLRRTLQLTDEPDINRQQNMSELLEYSRTAAHVRSTFSFFPDKILGNGGFGTVCEGLFHGRKVAVKRCMRDDYIEIEEKLLHLNHRNLVKYLAIEADMDFVYIVMELCAGTLEDVVRGKYQGPNPGSTEELLLQTARGLRFLHSHEIIHRDVKPRNILISAVAGPKTPTSVAKLADFRLCKLKRDDKSYFSKSVEVIGSCGWAAPECFDEDVDRVKFSADVFSLGCVFGYALTGGSHPFGDGSNTMRMVNIMNGKIAWQNENVVENGEMKTLIRSMISKETENRPRLSTVIQHLSSLTGEPIDNVNLDQAPPEPKDAFRSNLTPTTDEYELGDGMIYFPKKRLGKGYYGIVYEGICVSPVKQRQRVAIKLLRSEANDSKTIAEMNILNRNISHEHLVHYITAVEKNDLIYIVMELCAGTLDDLVNKKGEVPSPGSMENVVWQIALGVQHLHSAGIIHGDIKPANILVSKTDPPVMKIADFGLSKFINGEEAFVKLSGKLVCTPTWAAPELLKTHVENVINFSVDVFSLGCVFGYALTDGSHPFGKSRVISLINIPKGELAWEGEGLITNHSLKTMIFEMISSEAEKRPKINEIVGALKNNINTS